jgi:hypothetical protein
MLQCSCSGTLPTLLSYFTNLSPLVLFGATFPSLYGSENLKPSDDCTQAVRKGSETRFDASYALASREVPESTKSAYKTLRLCEKLLDNIGRFEGALRGEATG